MKPLLIRTKIMPYESLSSVVNRLAQANFYDSAWRIYRLIDLPEAFLRNQNLLSDRNIIKKLSLINICPEDEIFNTTAHRFARYFSDNKGGMLDSKTVENFFLRSSTRYCPLCLKESGHHKIYWELLPVSICTRHEVLLQNTCPKCFRTVRINRVLRNKCKCGGDLLSVNPISVAPHIEVIRNQIFIQNLLGINESDDLKIISEVQNSPAAKLPPLDFFKLIKIFSMLILNKLPKSSKFLELDSITAEPLYQIKMKNGISNLTNFILINSATSILLDWPQKFYEFLEEYSKIDRSKRWKTGVEKDFGRLKEILFAKLDAEKFDFIYSAYRNYLREHWTGGHLGNIKILDVPENQKMQKKHLTLMKAAEILGCDHYELVTKIINQKLIQAIVHEAGSKKVYIIDAESVHSLKRKMDRMLTYSDLANRLDIGIRNTKSLVKRGLLPPIKHKPWNSILSLFEPEDVEKFEKEFLSGELYTVVDKKPEGYLSILDAIEVISCTGINTARLLQLVQEGVFNPILCKEGKGLSRLLFSEDELRKYRDANSEKKRDNNKLSVYRTSEILGVHTRVVQRYIKMGLIKATVEGAEGEQKTCILKKDLDEFKSEYLLVKDAAALTSSNTETIFQWIKQGRLKDYAEISITRSGLRLLRREEIIPFMPQNMLQNTSTGCGIDLKSGYNGWNVIQKSADGHIMA